MKLKANIQTNSIASATAATAEATNRVLTNIEESNTAEQATLLRIQTLERQPNQQKQLNREILKSQKTPKDVTPGRWRLHFTLFPQSNTVDLTITPHTTLYNEYVKRYTSQISLNFGFLANPKELHEYTQ